MPAPQYNTPRTIDEARSLRREMLDVIKRIKSQLAHKNRQNKETGQLMTTEEFESWRQGARTALNAAHRDLSRVDIWIKDDLLRRATRLLIELGEDGIKYDLNELAIVDELKLHTGVLTAT